jgi:hypothetical protein
MALRGMAAADNLSLADACLPPLWVIPSMAPRAMAVAGTPCCRHGCLPMHALHCRGWVWEWLHTVWRHPSPSVRLGVDACRCTPSTIAFESVNDSTHCSSGRHPASPSVSWRNRRIRGEIRCLPLPCSCISCCYEGELHMEEPDEQGASVPCI